ncbi:alpha/beta fold hydrolase [Ideonella azotifigens]|uniref:Alpha/beta fold hydrolase n=1 Tax=Ideonella azotifigens TaxID=513160 RepID=A0ABP3VVZ0_9BURK|nr:alpha/beta fold hydrolase [Ideonella azotifigens]MCD2343438.1 alpha/beta fold hydrolase [Ideonella azotifigens]
MSRADTPADLAEPVALTCADGVTLRGHFLARSGGNTGEGGGLPVLIAPATGVRQHFYLRFAAWLATRGHDVLVFDYRGVGQSLHGPLKDCQATLAEWGQQDQVAALDWLLARTGQPQVLMLGHSAGAQMLGLLPNHHRVARLVGISASTGWFGGMRPAFRVAARMVLCGLVPLGIRLKGYGTCSAVGLGENLPAQVALQWGQWCSAGGYATNAVQQGAANDFHAAVRTPITVLHASDDNIATDKTVADLLRTLPAAPHSVRRVHPAELGYKAIGHIDWFRGSHKALWPLMAQALRAPG